MQISYSKHGRTQRFCINNHQSVIQYAFDSKSNTSMTVEKMAEMYDWNISTDGNSVVLKTPLNLNEHIIGLGEKAFNIDRRGIKFQMWNFDQQGYNRYDDPLYLSIPFYISIDNGSVKGVFLNSTARMYVDFGVEDYEHTTIIVEDQSLDLYLFEGETVEQVIEEYTSLTGTSLELPEWALSPHISRYSYYPDSRVLDVVDEYKKYMPVSAVHLDIDYMEDFKLFTWNKQRFPDPERMIRNLHEKGVKVITIVDPSFKVDQNYPEFAEGLGKYISTPNNEIYTGNMWPGKSAFLDFPSEDAENLWERFITKFVKTGVDGIWLDMNEPTILNESKIIDENNIHPSTGKTHDKLRNAYAFFQARSTYRALSKIHDKPFVLSRSGFSGIQKYAAIWTGDSNSTWDDLKLQISMVSSMGVSGLAIVGCDIGGFVGIADQELTARYYQMAAFFPLYRNHNDKYGGRQEIFTLSDRYRMMALKGVETRLRFIPYIAKLAEEASKFGHPIIRPLCYEFFTDENSFTVDDQYMVGKWLLFAPIVEHGAEKRKVYLPEGRWMEYSTGEILTGAKWVESTGEMPIYIREGAEIPVSGGETITFK